MRGIVVALRTLAQHRHDARHHGPLWLGHGFGSDHFASAPAIAKALFSGQYPVTLCLTRYWRHISEVLLSDYFHSRLQGAGNK